MLNYSQPFCGSMDMGAFSFLASVIQPAISGFSGALQSTGWRNSA